MATRSANPAGTPAGARAAYVQWYCQIAGRQPRVKSAYLRGARGLALRKRHRRPSLSYVDLEKRVRAKHPLRLVRVVVNEVLSRLDGDFAKAYAIGGRPSNAP